MTLKLNRWYMVSEKGTGCFEGLNQVIDISDDWALVETKNGARARLRIADWHFGEVNQVDEALHRIGMYGHHVERDRIIITRMLHAGYSL